MMYRVVITLYIEKTKHLKALGCLLKVLPQFS